MEALLSALSQNPQLSNNRHCSISYGRSNTAAGNNNTNFNTPWERPITFQDAHDYGQQVNTAFESDGHVNRIVRNTPCLKQSSANRYRNFYLKYTKDEFTDKSSLLPLRFGIDELNSVYPTWTMDFRQ